MDVEARYDSPLSLNISTPPISSGELTVEETPQNVMMEPVGTPDRHACVKT